MAASARIIAQDTVVTWDGADTLVLRGTIVDIPPGSDLEEAYGGTGNLVPTGPQALAPEPDDPDDPDEPPPDGT
jgi:hypothetical protein